jgi:hypothetical protein
VSARCRLGLACAALIGLPALAVVPAPASAAPAGQASAPGAGHAAAGHAAAGHAAAGHAAGHAAAGHAAAGHAAAGHAAAAPAQGPLSEPAEGDFLAENGLGSPLCRSGALDASERADCESSDFTAASAPTGNYAFDVHINTGITDIRNTIQAVIQDRFEEAWMLLITLVRGLVVALEWCYSLNLLSRPLIGAVTGALHGAAGRLTEPGLVVVLAIAAALIAWHGLIRRRVAQTLGEAAVMVAMIATGLAVIADPGDTVGAAARWADEASLGTLGAVAAGSPDRPDRTLASDLRGLFAEVVTGPWCYMEFGQVDWCSNPRRLDGRLRRAALRIAAAERSLAAGGEASGTAARAALAIAARLDRARTNGALFLALPANGPARNSINEEGSLLSVLCGGSREATRCRGPTAAQAEFRTQQGTLRRFLGLCLIWLGTLPMVALFAWIGLQLLRAALLTLVYLLMAPAAVLAPALGEGGRGGFRAWGSRLLGALVGKLVYSLLLGVVLLMASVLETVSALGWWMQWLLVCALWVIVFRHRHDLLALVRFGPVARWQQAGTDAPHRNRGLLGRARDRATGRLTDMAVEKVVERTWKAFSPPPLSPARRAQVEAESHRQAQRFARGQVEAALAHELDDARAQVARAPAKQAALGEERERLRAIEREQAHARAAADAHADPGSVAAQAGRRRAARLHARASRLRAQIAAREGALGAARRRVDESARAHDLEGAPFGAAQVQERARLYGEQAELPAKGRANHQGKRRDYRRLASLAGVAEREWDALPASGRRKAVLEIDRKLAERTALEGAREAAVRAREVRPSRRERRRIEHDLHDGVQQELRRLGHRPRSVPTASASLFQEFLEEGRGQRAGERPPVPLRQRARVARGRVARSRADGNGVKRSGERPAGTVAGEREGGRAARLRRQLRPGEDDPGG